MKGAFVAALLVTGSAYAQGAGSEVPLVLLVGPPALVSVALDIALLMTLAPTGTAKHGGAITTIVFGTIGILLSAICLGMGLISGTSTVGWNGISAGALIVETGSLVLGFYGLLRDEEASDEPAPPPRRPAPAKELPPQLFMLPFTFQL